MNGDSNILEIPSQGIPPPPRGAVPLKMTMPAGQPGAGDPFQPRDDLIKSIISRESSGNPKARGKAGEIGLMQILPATAAQYGIKPEQLADPEINRQAGTRYMSDLLKRFKGNEYLALMAYNSGPERVAKGIFLPQSAKYASDILANAQQPMPQIQAQPDPGQQQAPPPPSMLSRIGGAIGGALEGTAEAQEIPPPPSGAIPIGGGTMASASSPQPPTMSPSQAGPPPPALPSTASPPPPPSGAAPMGGMGQMKPSISFDSTGKMHVGLTTPNAPASVTTQQYGSAAALGQVDDAIKFYDQKIGPREGEFSGSLLSQTGRRGFMQPYEAQSSRWSQALGLGERSGGRGDRDVGAFYDKVGPIMAEQMKALIGGRVGQGLINGPIAPHLPNMDKDALPRIREKLEDLKENIPVMLNAINKMRHNGMNDDQILQSFGVDPASVPAAPGGGEVPPPPPGFQE